MKMKKVVLALSPSLMKDKAVVAYAMRTALLWMGQKKYAGTEKVYTYPLDFTLTILVNSDRVLVTATAEKAYIFWRDGTDPVLCDKHFREKPVVSPFAAPLPASAFAEYEAYSEEDEANPNVPPPVYPDGYTLVPVEDVNKRVELAMRRAGLTAGYWAAILYTHKYAIINSTTGWAVAERTVDYTKAEVGMLTPLLMERTNRAWCNALYYTDFSEDPFFEYAYKSQLYEAGAAHSLTVAANGYPYNNSTMYSRPIDVCSPRIYAPQSTEYNPVTEQWTTYDPPACTWTSPSCHTHSELRRSFESNAFKVTVEQTEPFWIYQGGPAEIQKAYDYSYTLNYGSVALPSGSLEFSPTAWTKDGKANIHRWDGDEQHVINWTGGYEFQSGAQNYSAGTIVRTVYQPFTYQFQLDRGAVYSRYAFAVGKCLWALSIGIASGAEADNVNIFEASHFSSDFTEQYEESRTTAIGYVRSEWTGPYERERVWDRFEGYNVAQMVDIGTGFYDESKQHPWEYDYKNSTVTMLLNRVGVVFVLTKGTPATETEEAVTDMWSSFYLDWHDSYVEPEFANTSPLDSVAVLKVFEDESYGQSAATAFMTEFKDDFYKRSPVEEQWARDLRYEFDKTGEFLVNKKPGQTEWNNTTGDWDYPEGYAPPEQPVDPGDEEE